MFKLSRMAIDGEVKLRLQQYNQLLSRLEECEDKLAKFLDLINLETEHGEYVNKATIDGEQLEAWIKDLLLYFHPDGEFLPIEDMHFKFIGALDVDLIDWDDEYEKNK